MPVRWLPACASWALVRAIAWCRICRTALKPWWRSWHVPAWGRCGQVVLPTWGCVWLPIASAKLSLSLFLPPTVTVTTASFIPGWCRSTNYLNHCPPLNMWFMCPGPTPGSVNHCHGEINCPGKVRLPSRPTWYLSACRSRIRFGWFIPQAQPGCPKPLCIVMAASY